MNTTATMPITSGARERRFSARGAATRVTSLFLHDVTSVSRSLFLTTVSLSGNATVMGLSSCVARRDPSCRQKARLSSVYCVLQTGQTFILLFLFGNYFAKSYACRRGIVKFPRRRQIYFCSTETYTPRKLQSFNFTILTTEIHAKFYSDNPLARTWNNFFRLQPHSNIQRRLADGRLQAALRCRKGQGHRSHKVRHVEKD